MSHEATKWALKQRGLKPAAKIVLFYLCDHHNDENGCFPSQELLASECEMSRSTLNLQLAKLEEMGLILRHASLDDRTKRQRPTRYVLAFEGDFSVRKSDESRVLKSDKAVSENKTEPCPIFDESRVLKSDTNPVREPLSQARPREAGPDRDRALRMRGSLIEAMGLTGSELNTSGTFIVQKMSPADIELSLDVWSQGGLSDDQIVAAVRAKMQSERQRDGQFMPRSARFFDGAIRDHAERLKRSGTPPGTADNAKEARRKRWKRIASA